MREKNNEEKKKKTHRSVCEAVDRGKARRKIVVLNFEEMRDVSESICWRYTMVVWVLKRSLILRRLLFFFSLFVWSAETFAVWINRLCVCLHFGFVAFVVHRQIENCLRACSMRIRAIVCFIRCDNASSARVRSHCLPNKDLSIDSIAPIYWLPAFLLPFLAMPWPLDWSTFYPEDAWKFGSRSRTTRASCYRYSHVWACWPNSQTHFQKVFSHIRFSFTTHCHKQNER